MKTIFFLPSSWRRKNKKVPTLPTSTPGPEHHIHFESSPSPQSKPTSHGSSSLHTLQFESFPRIDLSPTDSDELSHLSQGSSMQVQGDVSNKNKKSEPYRTPLGPNTHHGALFNIVHGPPQNTVHGPPHFNHAGRTARPSTAPSRPPPPPPLDLYSHPRPVSANHHSPNRVRFAPAPQIRPPESPSRLSFRHVGQTKGRFDDLVTDEGTPVGFNVTHYLQEPQRAEIPSCAVAERFNRLASKGMYLEELSSGAPVITSTRPPSPSCPPRDRTAHAIPDFSDPGSGSLYHTTSSDLHLPTSKDSSLSEFFKNDRQSGSSLTLISSPPPLVIRKRPKPLVLLPKPTLAWLPSSPVLPPSPRYSPPTTYSSADLTPPTTPIALSPPRSPLSNTTARRSPRKSFLILPPPTSSPPNTPLPTPPSSPSATPGVFPTRRLRNIHSATDFRSQYHHSSSNHHTTLSITYPDPDCPTEFDGGHTQSRSDTSETAYSVNIPRSGPLLTILDTNTHYYQAY